MARASRAPSVSVWTPRDEHRRKAFTLRHPHHRPSFYSGIRTVYCMLYRFSAAISYYCYLFTFLLVYIVLILDCVGYFHRPKKPLIQSRYTHISECFLLARLRRRINTYIIAIQRPPAAAGGYCFPTITIIQFALWCAYIFWTTNFVGPVLLSFFFCC